MSIIKDKITTTQDKNSETIIFEDYTPSKAYEILTDAVYSARFQPEYVQINIEQIPPNETIGDAKYKKDTNEIKELYINPFILEKYGVKL